VPASAQRPKPDVPKGLAAVADSSTQLTVTWQKAARADFHAVYRDGAVKKPGLVTTSYVDTTVQPSTTYSYTVKACKDAECSAPSEPARVRTPPATACTGVVISPGTDIQELVDRNPTGTTFCIKAGTYRLMTPIIPKGSDVLWGASGAVLNGSKVLTLFTKSGSYWYASGQTQQAPVETDSCLDPVYTGCKYPEGVYRDGASLWQVTSLSALSAGEFYFDYAADKIYLADDPTGHNIEASFVPEAIRGYGSSQTNVTIRGLVVEKFANWPTDQTDAIHGGTNWLIEDNEVRLNHGGGIKPDSGSTVTGNYVHDNGKFGVDAAFVDNVLIQDNEIARNNAEELSFWNAGATKVYDSSNITFQGNYVHHNTGHGLWSDGDSIYITYDGNTVENNTGCGILHEISYDATISNNVVRYNSTYYTGETIWYGSQIQVYDSPNVNVYGNTVESLANTHGIGVRDDERGSGSYGVHEARNDTVHDNTIKLGTGGQTGMVGSRNPNIYTSMGNKFTNNTDYVKDLVADSWRWGIGVDGILSWAEWQAKGNDLTGELYLW
jgi:parallel beta-helix repeat protein